MNTPRHLLTIAGLLLLATAACSNGPSTDSETHWLGACQSDDDCGEDLSCICNLCTLACDDDCGDLAGDAVCVQIDAAVCEVEAGAICKATCSDDEDCGEELTCQDQLCELPDGFEIEEPEPEPEPEDPPEPTLPRIAIDLDCSPEEGSLWTTLCDWVLDADVVVHGTLTELVIVNWDDGPGEPATSCEPDLAMNLRMTIAVEEPLRGDVGESVEVYLRSMIASSWYPYLGCDPDNVHPLVWSANSADSMMPGEGPLTVGQFVGIAAFEHEDGYLYNTYETNPLFVNRDDALAVQTGAAFECHYLRDDPELEALQQQPFQNFVDAALACGDEPSSCPNTEVDPGACPTECGDFPMLSQALRLDEKCIIDAPTLCVEQPQPPITEGDDAIGCFVHPEDSLVVLTTVYLENELHLDGWQFCSDWDGWENADEMNELWHFSDTLPTCEEA